ncbi:MAG: ABC transporter ATP-binding protein [Pseudomonadota bacterium]
MNNPFSGTQAGKTGSDRWSKRTSAGVVIASSMSFESIYYSVAGKTILEDVTLDVDPGSVLCLLGPSGSGKTSLLRIAAGLARQNRGCVSIDGRIVDNGKVFVPPENRGVGLVFQDYALFPHLTILQNVEFGLTALSKSEAREQAMLVLSRVGLEDRANQYPHILSGGEQQRVALARALAPRPGILLMDEPFSGLDSRLRETVREQSLELLRETRSTAIIVTHDAEEALRVGDQLSISD